MKRLRATYTTFEVYTYLAHYWLTELPGELLPAVSKAIGFHETDSKALADRFAHIIFGDELARNFLSRMVDQLKLLILFYPVPNEPICPEDNNSKHLFSLQKLLDWFENNGVQVPLQHQLMLSRVFSVRNAITHNDGRPQGINAKGLPKDKSGHVYSPKFHQIVSEFETIRWTAKEIKNRGKPLTTNQVQYCTSKVHILP